MITQRRTWRRPEIVESLRQTMRTGQPVIAAGASAGIIAKCAELAGADLLVVYSTGRSRLMGLPTTPIGDSNPQTLEMFDEISNVTQRCPVIGGIEATDPRYLALPRLLARFREAGYDGLINFPTIANLPDRRRIRDDVGLGFSREAERGHRARHRSRRGNRGPGATRHRAHRPGVCRLGGHRAESRAHSLRPGPGWLCTRESGAPELSYGRESQSDRRGKNVSHLRMRQLGRTAISVSELGLGGYQFTGEFGVPRREAHAIIREALGSGANFIDTAPMYGAGESEELIGRALTGAGKPVVVSGKVGYLDLTVSRYFGADGYRSEDALRRVAEHSLHLLRKPKFDVLFIHEPEWPEWALDPATGDSVVTAALERMRAEGLTDAIGVAGQDVDLLADSQIASVIPGARR